MTTSYEPFTMAEAMAMLDCSEESLVGCIERGEVSAIKRGRSWVFPRGAFLSSLDQLAEAEREARRAEHDAKRKASTAITKAKTPSSGRRERGRTPPALPSLQ